MVFRHSLIGGLIGVLIAHGIILILEWAMQPQMPTYSEFMRLCIVDHKLAFCHVMWSSALH